MISRRHASRSAFTLMELLVVVSVIALLVSIMLPSLGKAKMQAKRVVCGTRMRGLSVALQVYFADFDNTLPVNGLILPKSHLPLMYQGNTRFVQAETPFKDQWRLEFGALWPYMGGAPVPMGYSMATAASKPLPPTNLNMAKRYICPDDATLLLRTYKGSSSTNPGSDPNASTPLTMDYSTGVARVLQGPGAPGYWSYSVNSVLNSLGRFRDRFAVGELPWTDPLRMINVKAPSQFITFVEEDDDSLFNDEVFDPPAYNNGDKLAGRHGFTGNVAFGDAHVEVFNQTIFNQVPSGIAGQYVNHQEALTSDTTRMFFPDRGGFGAQ
jgi:prepilin-type N-terminal cleavage/methylation domain-containing protein/prepilin-type processing-associated H-X9-DG protein